VLRYFDDLEAEFLKVSSQKRHSFLSFLDNVMEGRPQTLGIPAISWYDQGLFYVDDFGNYCVLNPIAREALDLLWRQHRIREEIGKPGTTGSATGAIFEREIIRGLFQCQSQVELHPFYLKTEKGANNVEPAKPLVISTIIRMLSFYETPEDLKKPSGPKKLTVPVSRPACCVLTPMSQRYPGLDFIIEDTPHKQIVLVQVTTQLPHQHIKDKLQILFNSGKLAQLLQSLLGAEPVSTVIDTKDSHFVVTLPEPYSGWQVKFLYITSQHDTDVQKTSWQWRDVMVAGRETIKPLNLLFAKDF